MPANRETPIVPAGEQKSSTPAVLDTGVTGLPDRTPLTGFAIHGVGVHGGTDACAGCVCRTCERPIIKCRRFNERSACFYYTYTYPLQYDAYAISTQLAGNCANGRLRIG